MENNQKFENYNIIEKIGEGGFGSAYKVINKENNRIYAIKQISLKNASKKEIDSIIKEAKILSSINSEYVVKYFGSFSDKEYFNIVMEYCDGLDLRTFLYTHREKKNFIKEELIYHIMKGICQGISAIHKKNLIHRDLKPENIFLTSNFNIKIGDFGIAKQLNSVNEFAKTQSGTLLYMAPEIVKGEKYNNKVDIWALGCILYELCTLNYCFFDISPLKIIEKIKKGKFENINSKLYITDLQKLLDNLLNINYKKRPNIDDIIKIITKNEKTLNINSFKNMINEVIINLIKEDEAVQNYIIEKNIQDSLDQMSISVYLRERQFFKYKYYFCSFATYAPFYCGLYILIGNIGALLSLLLIIPISLLYFKIFDPFGKSNFINGNMIIIEKINDDMFKIIKEKLKEKKIKEKDQLIIYSESNFERKIEIIKKKLITKKLKNLKKVIRNNFNILLVGNTNVGKSTLINEFLKLEKEKRAKESDGGPTEIDPNSNVHYKPYTSKKNDTQYTLYDSNGITNKGKDSIENKIKYTSEDINKRIKDGDPNKLYHCIWYCFQGSSIQPSDEDFIKELLEIYSTQSIPIIFVHTQTYDDDQSETCKKGLKKYLLNIFNNNEQKANELLDNYINILARGNKYISSFGLDELEKLTKKEIEHKGFESAYFELIKNEITPILLNGAFNLVFTEYNLNKLISKSLENLDKYLEEVLLIINDDSLGLDENVKKENKENLNKLYGYFKDKKNNLKDDLEDLLDIKKLRKNNQEFIEEVYNSRSDEYKKEMDFKQFSKKVDNLIYDNITHEKKKIVNNIMNIGFNDFVIQIIKEGIEAQLKQMKKNVINQIYSELFKENENNSIIIEKSE